MKFSCYYKSWAPSNNVVMLSMIKTSRLLRRVEYQSCLKIRNDVIGTMAPGKPNPEKTKLREQIEAKIAALTAEEKKRQSKIVYEKIISHPWYKSASRVALFMSTDQEIDTSPIIAHIQSRGATAFVPQYAGGNMRMLKIERGDESSMQLTKHGIAQHSKEQIRENALDGGLDLIIAPGVAFSRRGARLGHGGGYYDKFISNLRATTENAPKVMAVAYACQITDEVPMDDHDQKMDAVIFAE